MLVGVGIEAADGMGPGGAGGSPAVVGRAKPAVGGMVGGGPAYAIRGSQQRAFLVDAADGLLCVSWCLQVVLAVQVADGLGQAS